MMTKKQLNICKELYSIAQQQFEKGIITQEEYLDTLYLIRHKISDIKKGFNKVDFICKSINKPILEINVQETVNFVLAMN